jgi:phosphoribosylanthranilate isomerase
VLALGWVAFKGLRLGSQEDLAQAVTRYTPAPQPPAYLVDAYRPGQYGGTGQTANWSLAASLSIRNPILLAGGLSEANVAMAIRQVRPWGVDVASGVERSPGRKDPKKMEAFIHAARNL